MRRTQRRSRPRRPSKRTDRERLVPNAERGARSRARAETASVSRRSVLRAGALAGSAGLLAAGLWKFALEKPVGAQRASAPLATTPSAPSSSTPPTSIPAASDVYRGWVQDENALPGTAAWNIPNLGDQHAVEGFFDVTSATIGNTVQLFVSTTASTFHVEAYRMGWYQGSGRSVWCGRPPKHPGVASAATHGRPSDQHGRHRLATTAPDRDHP